MNLMACCKKNNHRCYFLMKSLFYILSKLYLWIIRSIAEILYNNEIEIHFAM